MTTTPNKFSDPNQSGSGSVKTFSDHMAECNFVDGEWRDPGIKPYSNLQMDPSSTIFHYGQSVFEGMKVSKNKEGRLCMFRPLDHLQCLNNSALRLSMPTMPKELFFSLLVELLIKVERWADKSSDRFLYIKAGMFATDTSLAASPSVNYKFIITCSPALESQTELRVKISEDFSRAAQGGVGATTSGGNYAAEFYPLQLAQREGFQQLLWTDAETNSFLEQLGNMNLFLRIGSSLVTPPINDRIFDGVTRKSVISLAEQEGIPVEVREITVSELVKAAKNHELLEMFGTETLSGVTSIRSFRFRGSDYTIPRIIDPYAPRLEKKLLEIQYDLNEDTFGWCYRV